MSTQHSPTTSHRSGGWFKHRDGWSALAVVAVTVAVWALASLADSATPQRTELVTLGKTVTLGAESGSAGKGLVVTPAEGWTIVAGGSAEQLKLTRDGSTVSVALVDGVEDVNRYFDRKARELRFTRQAEVVRGTEYRVGSGFAGVQGSALGGGRQGELVVLGKKIDDSTKGVTVLSLLEPGHAAEYKPAVDRMVESIKETA